MRFSLLPVFAGYLLLTPAVVPAHAASSLHTAAALSDWSAQTMSETRKKKRAAARPAPDGRCLVDLGYGRWESCDAE